MISLSVLLCRIVGGFNAALLNLNVDTDIVLFTYHDYALEVEHTGAMFISCTSPAPPRHEGGLCHITSLEHN